MINNFALNIGVDAGLSLVSDVMDAVSGSQNLPVSASNYTDTGAGSGGQGVFAQMLNDSIAGQNAGGGINNSNGGLPPLSRTSVNPPAVNNFAAGNNGNSSAGQADNSYGGGSPVSGQSPANGGAAGAANNMPAVSSAGGNSSGGGQVSANQGNSSAGKSAGTSGNSQPQTGNVPVNESNNNSSGKPKNDKIKNNGITAAAQPLFFAGNVGIILQPLSANKTGKGENGETANGVAAAAKPDGKNSNASAIAVDMASSGKTDNQFLSLSLSNNSDTGGKDYAGNSSGKTGLSAIADNAAKKISDNASGQNAQAAPSGQSAPDKTGNTAAIKNPQNPMVNNISHNIEQKAASVFVNAGNQNNRRTASAELVENSAVKSATSNNAAAANADVFLKGAAVNAFNQNALSGEAKPAFFGADGKNQGNITGGNAVSFQGAAGYGLNNPASDGNSGGLSLAGGNIAGLDDSAPETAGSGSAAVNSVMFMLKRNIQTATITLNPASLGTVKINIALNGPNSALNQLNQSTASNGSITINMLAQNEAAKNIIQASSDSLQNALKNQGFSSINLNISTGSGYNNNGNGNNGSETFKNPFAGANYNGGFSSGTSVFAGANNNSIYRNPNALVDYFA